MIESLGGAEKKAGWVGGMKRQTWALFETKKKKKNLGGVKAVLDQFEKFSRQEFQKISVDACEWKKKHR